MTALTKIKLPEASVDFETRSAVDLRKAGAHRYAEDPSTSINCMAWAIGDEEPQLWWPGEPFPERLRQHIESGGLLYAFNAAFERALWRYKGIPVHGFPKVKLTQWRCTAAMAAAMSLPRALADCAAVLGTPMQKDALGYRIMMQMAKPRTKTKLPDGREVYTWYDDAERKKVLGEYCKQDVRTERDIKSRLFALSDREQWIWHLDQLINDRGVLIDLPMVAQALKIAETVQKRLDFRMVMATGGQVAGAMKTSRLTKWLQEKGLSVESLAKADMRAILADPDVPEELREVVAIRQEAAKTSIAKLKAMQQVANLDGRARGLLLYHGAGTGRWCLAEGTPVRVKFPDGRIGEVPIEHVTTDMLVHDGTEWVRHEGSVFSGVKPVIYYNGLVATREHVVYLSDDEKTTLIDAVRRKAKLWQGEGVPPDTSENFAFMDFDVCQHTYDILNAGPRNRFIAAGFVVSNSGMKIQPQNLPRPQMKQPWEALEEIATGKADLVEMMHGDPLQAIVDNIRSMLIAGPGKKFVVCDYNSIEARIVAWLAGQEDVLDVFRRKEDIYCFTGSQVYGRPINKKDHPNERQVGKVACVAEGELVLTDHGLVPIESVKLWHRVWDGAEWVSHGGAVCQGEMEVITYDGLSATADHIVFTEDGRNLPFGECASKQIRIAQTGFGREAIRYGRGDRLGDHLERRGGSGWSQGPNSLPDRSLRVVRDDKRDQLRQSSPREIERLPIVQSDTPPIVRVDSDQNGRGALAVSTPAEPCVPAIRRERGDIRLSDYSGSHTLDSRESGSSGKTDPRRGDRQDRQLARVRAGEPALHDQTGEREQPRQHSEVQNRGTANPDNGRNPRIQTPPPGSEILGQHAIPIDAGEHDGIGYPRSLGGSVLQTKRRVWDILNAGPRHRFTVSGKLVHNCLALGYAGGVGAFAAMAKLYNIDVADAYPTMWASSSQEDRDTAEHAYAERGKITATDLSREAWIAAELIKIRWRRGNFKIAQLWKDVGKAMLQAVQNPGTKVRVGHLVFLMSGSWLIMGLPSGRTIIYPGACIRPSKPMKKLGEDGEIIEPEDQEPGRPSVWAWGINSYTKKWELDQITPGTAVENATQGVAACVLRDGMIVAEQHKFPIVLTVHDELVTEPDENHHDHKFLEKLLSVSPEWAPGLPITAEGWQGKRYRKA